MSSSGDLSEAPRWPPRLWSRRPKQATGIHLERWFQHRLLLFLHATDGIFGWWKPWAWKMENPEIHRIHLAEWLEMDGLMGFWVETNCAIETSWWKLLGHAIFSILAEMFPARS